MQFVFIFGLMVFNGAGVYADVLDGLVGRWEFDEGQGSTTADSTGGAPDGQLGSVDVTWRNHGNNTYCLQFKEDVDSGVVIPHSSSYTVSEGTYCHWVNFWWGGHRTSMLEKNETFRIRLYRSYADCRFEDTSGKQVENKAYPRGQACVTPAEWTHIAVTADSSNIKMYVNGELAHTVPFTGNTLKQASDSFYIGGSPYGEFTGCIDDMRIYNRVLSPQEISNIYAYKKDFYANSDVQQPSAEFIGDRGYTERLPQPGDEPLYEAWLHYRPMEDSALKSAYEKVFKNVVVQGNHPVVRTAGEELGYALKKMLGHRIESTVKLQADGNIILGTPQTSPLIASVQSKLNLSRIGREGFVIERLKVDGKNCLVVAANSPAGVVYGTFALIRRLQLRRSADNLDIAEKPKTSVRIINHWDFFRGFKDDAWIRQGSRRDSIFSWQDLKTGNTKRIRDWARLLASAGFNAICPNEINWSERNNFLQHLDEVKVLADILRNYGIKLYWAPNYLFAPKQSTADALYKYVPDFGGYLLKFGSEGQPGSPGPENVNAIARTLAPYGGEVLLRAFIYGQHFDSEEKHRSKIAYLYFVPLDGQYDKNVTIVQKFTPFNFEVRAPINPLDGAIKKTRYGTEVMVAKWFPMSWIQTRKRWLEFDNYKDGPGSFNKNYIDCVLGDSLMSPVPSWTSNPLNMVNYYGLGRLAWNPDLSVEDVQGEWIKMTFGLDKSVQSTVSKILLLSSEVAQNLTLYSDYRGIRIMYHGDEIRTRHKSFFSELNREGIGADGIGAGFGSVYAPEVQKLYEDPVQSEDYLLAFRYLPYDYKLTNGKTIIQDIYSVHNQGVDGAKEMLALWKTLEKKVDARRHLATKVNFEEFVKTAVARRDKVHKSFIELTGILPERQD